MKSQISWRVTLAVKPGKLKLFVALTGEMVESTRKESGVLSYERFITEDAQFVHVYERYADSRSAVAHLRKFRETFADRFSSMVDRKEFAVYGVPSEELRLLLDGYGAMYLKPLAHFEYWS